MVNLISNPGFEEDFTGWQVWVPTPELATVGIDTVKVYSGLKSAKFIIIGAAGGRVGINTRISRDSLAEGQTYPFKIRHTSTYPLTVWFYFRDNISDAVIRGLRLNLPANADWQTSAMEILMPVGDEWAIFGSLQIAIAGDSTVPGEANVDDLDFPSEIPVATLTFQSIPINVIAIIDSQSIMSGQSIAIPLNSTVTLVVPQEVEA